MKKSLIIGVLVLLIVSSMVAGTLAVYSNTIDLGGNAKALRFYIGATETKTADLKLAPGKSDDYTFSVTNVNPADDAATEVDMDLTITTTVPEGFGTIAVTLKLGGEDYTGTVENGIASFAFENWSAAGDAKTANAKLIYTWVDNGDENQYDIGEAGNSAAFTVTVTGTQHVG